MKFELTWSAPISLRKSRASTRLLEIADLEGIPQTPGIYCFARKSGDIYLPIYVGKANRLRRRVRQQLNNLRLMLGLQNHPGRRRFLILGEYQGKAGPRAVTAITIAERALIEFALAQGCELINQQGTRRPKHFITNSGSRPSRSWLPHHMATPKKR